MRDIRSVAVVLFLVAVLLLSTGAFAPLWTDTTAHDQAIEGTPALQLLWAAVYAMVAALLVPYAPSILALLRANKLLLHLLALCVISATWSENPVVTLRKCIALVGTMALGLLLALRFDLRDQLRLIAAVLGLAALASLCAALFFPSSFPATEFSASAWNGVFSHKNLLGRSMCLGTIAFLSLERRSLAEYLLSFSGAALCFAMLLASHSQTALVVLLGMLLLMGLTSFLCAEWRQAVGALLLMIVGSVPIAWSLIAYRADWIALLGRNESFTGRTKIWDASLLSIAQRPWLGYGYGAFWWVAQQSRQALALIGYPTPHAHNGFLDIALQLGIFGLVAFAALWLLATFAALHQLRSTPGRAARWPLYCLVFAVLYSFSESSLLAANSLLWILFTAACISTARQRQIQLHIARRVRSLILHPVPLP